MTRSRTATLVALAAAAIALAGITGCSSTNTPAAAATATSSSTTPTATNRPATGSCWEVALDAGVELDFDYTKMGGTLAAQDPTSPLAVGTRDAIAKAPLACDPLITQYRITKAAVADYHRGTTAAAMAKWHTMADSIQMP